MKLLVVSDEESEFIWNHFDPQPFEGVEVILSCGDLKESYLDFLMTMLHAPLFYVPGNHDKRFAISPPEGADSVDGQVVTFKGLRIAGLGGCHSGRNAAYEYPEPVQAKRVKQLDKKIKKANGIDIFLTHAPALGLGDGDDFFHRGFACYLTLLDKYEPRYHIFGHQHKRYSYKPGPTVYGKTKLLNACGYHILEI